MPTCTHLDGTEVVEPPSEVAGCEECLETGQSWVSLRICQTCGHIGCCDSSPGAHATAHYQATGHPVMRSAQPDQTWRYCYVDQVTAEA